MGNHPSGPCGPGRLRPCGRPGTRRAASTSLLGLAPGGVCPAGASPRRRCALTAPFHPCRRRGHVRPRHVGGVFLWHFPAGFPGSHFATTPPCGVRTFLEQPVVSPAARGCLASPTRVGARAVRVHPACRLAESRPRVLDRRLFPFQRAAGVGQWPLHRGRPRRRPGRGDAERDGLRIFAGRVDGRKRHAAGALYDADGTVCAVSRALWNRAARDLAARTVQRPAPRWPPQGRAL